MSTMNEIIGDVQYLFDVAFSEMGDSIQRKLSSDGSELVVEELGNGSDSLTFPRA